MRPCHRAMLLALATFLTIPTNSSAQSAVQGPPKDRRMVRANLVRRVMQSTLPDLLATESLNSHTSTSTDSSGIFLEAATYNSGGADAAQVVVGDVNGDGKPDMVVANQCVSLPNCPNGVVGVLLGNGDGTFKNPQDYNSGDYGTTSIAVADVNGDRKLDVIVGNISGTVSVLLGNGDGTFQAPRIYASGGYLAYSLAIKDVNRDGEPDVVVGDGCESDADCSNGAVAVLLGNGDGTFQSPQIYPSGGWGEYQIAIAVDDVNHDGSPDIVVANECSMGTNLGCTDYAGVVEVLLGKGDGTFHATGTFSSGGFTAESIAIADVNGDGKPDLLVGNDCIASGNGCASSGSVGILLGNGDGTFQTASTYSLGGPFAWSIAVADINKDGRPDLVISNRDINILLGNGNGTFQPVQSYGTGGYNTFSIALSDVNSDRSLDILTSDDCPTDVCENPGVEVFLGNGDGTLQAARDYGSAGYKPDQLAEGVVNGDDSPDLLGVSPCGDKTCLVVFLGKKDGTFKEFQSYSLAFAPSAIATGDVNGDGKLDVLLVSDQCATPSYGCARAGVVEILIGNGDGTFQAARTFNAGYNSESIVIADVNRDGKPDLIVGSVCLTPAGCGNDPTATLGSISVFLGNGDGTFQAARTFSSGGYNTESIVVADVNGDGKSDLLVGNECLTPVSCNYSIFSEFPYDLGGISVLLGNGDGTFQTAQNYSSGGYFPGPIAVGDINRDGKRDILVVNGYSDSSHKTGGLALLLGNGNGTFQTAQTVSTFQAAGVVGPIALADFNADRKLDVAISALNALLLGNGDGTFQPLLGLGATGASMATGFFNDEKRRSIAIAAQDEGLTILNQRRCSDHDYVLYPIPFVCPREPDAIAEQWSCCSDDWETW